MNKRILAEFNIYKEERNSNYSDYDTFSNKELLEELRNKIIETINTQRKDNSLDYQNIKEIVDNSINNLELNADERNYLYDLIQNEITSRNPLTELLENDNITEIMVNDINDIYVEVDGKLKKDTNVSFINEQHITRTVEQLLAAKEIKLSSENPMIDESLEDGSRIIAIIPPLSKKPTITIRKYKQNTETIEDFIGRGMLTPEMADLLARAVEAKLNILITGSSGSGKTSFLNVISNFIVDDERIITIEDIFELQLKANHVIALETRRTKDGPGQNVTTKDLLKNAIRLRPDRIIIGEIRGEEAFDYIEIMNIGYEGTISTIHANNAIDAINRLETLSTIGPQKVPVSIIKSDIANNIDLVVHINKLKDGRRKVTEIISIEGTKNNEIEFKKLYEFRTIKINEKGIIEGEFIKTSGKSRAVNKLIDKGFTEIKEMFKESKK